MMPPEKEELFGEMQDQLFPTERLEDYLALSLAALIIIIILVCIN